MKRGQENRGEKIKQIENEILNLKKSPLFNYRKDNAYFPVIGEGDYFAKTVFIGEAPGKNEAKTGRPFCGASGRILDELLFSIGVDRSSVYITNIVKDRPPENRDPKPEEIDLYAPFLDRQLEIIKPKIIATLGRFSMKYVLGRYLPTFEIKNISQLHGKPLPVKMPYGDAYLLPLYHPAVAVYNANRKKDLLKDMLVTKKFLKENV